MYEHQYSISRIGMKPACLLLITEAHTPMAPETHLLDLFPTARTNPGMPVPAPHTQAS